MLWWNANERSLEVVEFELHIAIALIQEGELVIPVWLDRIHQRVAKRLAEESDRVYGDKASRPRKF